MPSKTEDVEAKYGVVFNFPNLELHSAAASGNLGLVHYALTHGQPVNSVLHGVLPLHAACSGGSVDVVKMLIERGANVNAPRLPRRYSDGRKSNAPSVGTAGSTPLHFAAANGHAPIVQILLACGAVPDKPDKNGMTPEALAEIQGHTEVIRVMRAWETLHPSQPYSPSDEGGGSEAAEVGSPSVGEIALSEDGWYDGSGSGVQPHPSRKGKERAFSFSSAKSELSVPAVKVKKSLEGFFRRTSRSGSMSNPGEASSPTPLRISTFSDESADNSGPDSAGYYSPFINSNPASPVPHATDEPISYLGQHLDEQALEGTGANTPLTRVTSGDSTILAPPNPPFRASSPSSYRSGGSSTVLAMARPSRSESRVEESIDETESTPSEYEPALETIEQELESEGTDPSRRSADSNRPVAVSDEVPATQTEQEQPPLTIHHTMPPRHTFSSRRPSLPSILEKAAHPGQAFRNAIRRDRHASESTPTIPEDPSQPKSGTFLRGRKHSNEPSPPHSAGRRFGTIKGFFRRGNSPPSRSPSPPKKNAIHPDELDERLRRASLDMSQSEGSSADNRDEITVPPLPHSAPAAQTRFFEDLSDNSDLRMAALASLTPRQPSTALRPPARKVSGGVLVPSPLANEVQDFDRASSAMSNPTFRRAKTEVVRGGTPSPRRSATGTPGVPGLPIHTKRRSATLPSQPRGPGFDWEDGVSLRRAAASEVIRRNSEKLRQAVEEAEARTDDGESVAEVDADVGVEQATPKEQEVEQETPHVSDGERDEDEEGTGDVTPDATPAVEKPEPRLGAVPEPASPARHRGASIGSFTTDSTRLSTPSVSTNPHMSIVSYDTGSERYHPANRSPTFAPDKVQLRAPPNSVVAASIGENGRPRGNTTSSESSGTSGMNFSSSAGQPSASTPPTSLTPSSALGKSNSGFPPVPEHEQEPTSPRKALTRQEAKKLVKQNELDILQLAQLPPSLDSSKSLAAQLAAYGENHQLEQEIAAEERRARRRAGKAAAKESDADGDATGTESFVSATSGDEDQDPDGRSASGRSVSGGSSSGRTTGSSALRMTTIKHDREGMYRAEAPRSTVPSINNIYDRRAAAYREKLQALTSIQPSVPSSLGHSHSHSHAHSYAHGLATPSRSYSHAPHLSHHHHHGHGQSHSQSQSYLRPRAFSSNSIPFSQASSSLRHVSSPLPSSSTTTSLRTGTGAGVKLTPSGAPAPASAQRSSKYTLHPQTPPGTSSLRTTTTATTTATGVKPRRKTHPPPPPIADVVNARFAGLPAPPPAPPISASPYVSIFSSRYSGAPHDGGDSDDSENGGVGPGARGAGGGGAGPTRYTVIENDWRGGHIVNYDGEFKRNKWGQIKGAIGHLGRKAS